MTVFYILNFRPQWTSKYILNTFPGVLPSEKSFSEQFLCIAFSLLFQCGHSQENPFTFFLDTPFSSFSLFLLFKPIYHPMIIFWESLVNCLIPCRGLWNRFLSHLHEDSFGVLEDFSQGCSTKWKEHVH